jgi:hypothetical protein
MNTVPFNTGWITFFDIRLGFTLTMDPAKHTPAQINATYKLLEYIAQTHQFSDDKPEDTAVR